MNLNKLTLNHLITLVLIIIGFISLLMVGQTSLNAIQTALSIDQAMAEKTAIQLNRNLLNKAVELIDGKK